MASSSLNPSLLSLARTLPNVPWCTDYEKMISGMLYNSLAPELSAGRFRIRRLCHKYNRYFPDEATEDVLEKERFGMLKEMLGSVGKGAYVEPPLTLDYGCNVRVGERFYANFK